MIFTRIIAAWFAIGSLQAADLFGPYTHQGGKNNYLPIGILMTNTTLNDGLLFNAHQHGELDLHP